jgi:RES domain-containing protein
MRLWRLAKAIYPQLDGEGARLFGGRWNSPGSAMVYTASSLALAVVEALVHLNPDQIPVDLMAFEIDIPDDITTEILHPLPKNWRKTPAPTVCQLAGNAWIRSGRTAVLIVPSAVIPNEKNYLLNPKHEDMGRVKVVGSERFTFDARLLKTGK